jgi:hypothetical protein
MFNVPSFFGFQFAGGFVGLLDLYPNSAAAYSLRKLRAAYTGSAIRVRRTDLAESDIGFTSSGDLDTTALLVFTGTGALDNGFVTTWYDQSGNGNNATQTNALSQPQIVSAGSVILENGKPAISFNLDFLQSISAYPTQEHQNSFYVAQSTGINNRVVDTRGTGASVQGWHCKFSNTMAADVTTIDDGVSSSLRTENIIRTGQKLVSVLMYGGSGSSINEYTNGSLSQSVSDATTRDFNSGNVLTIAYNSNGQNAQPLIGNLQEIVLYNIDQSSNQTGIETNINDFYSIYP